MLTIDDIRAAQKSDIAATTAVIEATDSRVTSLANQAARRMAEGGPRNAEYREEFAQVGRIAVWEALPRFAGDSVDGFYGFIYATVQDTLTDAVRSERNGDADADAVKVFASQLENAGGDVFLAEKLAQTVPPKGRRLSAERANAARLAWQGSVSIDAPIPAGGRNGDRNSVTETSIAFTLAGDLGVPEELLSADDLNAEQRRVKCMVVHGVLDLMGSAQRTVLEHSFGIRGATIYGHGLHGDDEGLAAEIDSTVKLVRDARSKGYKTFAKRYIGAVATSDSHAEELRNAATANSGRL